jgi:dienelactone hydrolase
LKKIPLFFITLLVINLLSFCKKHHTKEEKQADRKETTSTLDTVTSKGIVVDTVKCGNDITQSYAIYLPTAYKYNLSYPVIFIFDPQARGKLPVKKYQVLAEKYGYILAGSNNSKNGQPWETTEQNTRMLIDDVCSRFAIDKRRIYTMGFSGGARVASSLAISRGDIRGVIGCGGGFPQTDHPIQSAFSFMGMVGNIDFNYIEMNNLDKELDKTSLPHQLIVFDGKHEWPDEKIMQEGFLWFAFRAMKEEALPIDETMIQEYKKNASVDILGLKKSGNPNSLYISLKKHINYLEGLTDVIEWQKMSIELGKSEKLQMVFKSREQTKNAETGKQQEYMQAMTSKDMNWWIEQIGILNKYISSGRTEEKQFTGRLKNYISLVSNLQTNQALKNNDYKSAQWFLQIYELADPENPDMYYLKAYMSAHDGKEQDAIKYLKIALKLGYTDAARLKTDATFESARKNPEFEEILGSIK